MFENPHGYIELNKTQADILIHAAEKFTESEILRCCELLNNAIININRYTTNKKIVIEMLLIEMCFKYTEHITDKAESASADVIIPDTIITKTNNNARKPHLFDRYADFVDEVAVENKMISPFLKSGKCIIDDENKKITIYTDTGLKLELLKKPENLAIIKSNLYKFVDSSFSVFIEPALKDSSGSDENGNSIDDIIALTN
jgi:uncharacterized protein YqgQ